MDNKQISWKQSNCIGNAVSREIAKNVMGRKKKKLMRQISRVKPIDCKIRCRQQLFGHAILWGRNQTLKFSNN